MTAGRLQIKKGYWYAVLSLKNETGKHKTKWFSTHLPVKGNKRRAEEILLERRKEHTIMADTRDKSRGIFFDTYMAEWIAGMESKVAPTTFHSYRVNVLGSICPYFRERSIPLCDLKPAHIQAYYGALHERGLSNNTIIRHHANIRKALQEAYYKELILNNPADRVQRPKAEKFISHPYSVEESNRLLEATRGEKLELVVLLALFYGLRRSEVLGLRWGAIDFELDTIAINHSLQQTSVKGHHAIVSRDKLKHISSLRTLPLVPEIKARLLREKERRNPESGAYVCVDEAGAVIQPDYVSLEFPKLLERHNLRPIRFHDLRHGCANLLIGQRVPLIEVQQWLGHSTISNTADLYAHLDFSIKQNSAETLKKI